MNFKKILPYAMPVVALALMTAGAHADTNTISDVQGITDDASTLLNAVYPIVIGAVTFGILISLIKMVKRK